MTTATLDRPDTDSEVEDAFRAALERDAVSAPPELPPPPRMTPSSDPDAPHGRDDQGQPLTPFGTNKKTGKPNLKAGGPGRGKTRADMPRTTSAPRAVGKAVATSGQPDYREDLAGLGMSIWMGGAMLPPTRPYAHVWKQALPGMVNAWNEAAQQNETVRGYVEKLAGDGSWAWVLGVAVTTAPFLASCWQLAKPEKDPERKELQKQARAKLAAECEAEFTAYIGSQLDSMVSQEGGSDGQQ